MASVYEQAQAFIRALEQLHTPALAAYQAELERILPVLEAQAVAAAERIAAMQAAGVAATDVQVFAAQRARIIAAMVQDAVNALSAALVTPIEGATLQALLSGVDAASALIEAQLPTGVPLAFARPNLGALQAALGAQQGAPLVELFNALGVDAGRSVRTRLNAGLLAGHGPRSVANVLQGVSDLTQQRAEVIARTETLRAFRVSSLETYKAAGIQRYRRLAAKSARTCAACLALDGVEQDTDQVMAVHPNDRCAVVPIVEGFSQPPRENGAEWLAHQSADMQRAILGKGGAEAYQRGTPLARFARVEHDPDWGPTVRVARLSEVA